MCVYMYESIFNSFIFILLCKIISVGMGTVENQPIQNS